MSAFMHHPIRAIEHEAHHLIEVEDAGESAETPLLALLGPASFLLPLAALIVGIAFGVAWLVTGSVD
jgi:hypothetical protein